jgi:hypothetical protein
MSESDSSQPGGPAITGDDTGPDHPGQPPDEQPEGWQDGPPGEPGDDEDDGYVPL